jgi:hypothetical protein
LEEKGRLSAFRTPKQPNYDTRIAQNLTGIETSEISLSETSSPALSHVRTFHFAGRTPTVAQRQTRRRIGCRCGEWPHIVELDGHAFAREASTPFDRIPYPSRRPVKSP